MDFDFPGALRAKPGRERYTFDDDARELLVSASLQRRQDRLRAELERYTDGMGADVPPLPETKPPRNDTAMLPHDPDAIGGKISLCRNAWVAKYNPTRANTDASVGASDVYNDFPWGDPAAAIADPWIHSERMRSVSGAANNIGLGDLIFAMRTMWDKSEDAWLKRRCLVGVWYVECATFYPVAGVNANVKWVYEYSCVPIKRFDFPVPIVATGQQDAEFFDVEAFRDRSRRAFIGLSAQEALTVARDCGLPATFLTESDPGKLVEISAGLDLGPPTAVRRRILEGARAVAHKKSVEASAVTVVVNTMGSQIFGMASREHERGIGYDLDAVAVEHDGSMTEVHIEVKGLSGTDPWNARLTESEIAAAKTSHANQDGKAGSWWLVVVTNALNANCKDHWISARVAASVFTVRHDRTYSADRSAIP